MCDWKYISVESVHVCLQGRPDFQRNAFLRVVDVSDDMRYTFNLHQLSEVRTALAETGARLRVVEAKV